MIFFGSLHTQSRDLLMKYIPSSLRVNKYLGYKNTDILLRYQVITKRNCTRVRRTWSLYMIQSTTQIIEEKDMEVTCN